MATNLNEEVVQPAPVAPPVAPTVSQVAPEQISQNLGATNQAPFLSEIQPTQVYTAPNIQQIDIPSNKKASKMKLSDMEKKIAKAKSVAELNQIEIMNQPIAMGVLTGQAAHQSRLDTARLNSYATMYNARLEEQKRKDAEKAAFIEKYGADPSQRPKGMSKREFAKALTEGQFSNLLTMDYKIKQAQYAKAMSPDSAETGTWSVTTDNDGNQVMINNKTAEIKPMGMATATDNTSQALTPAGQKIMDTLKANSGTDQKVDPNKYLSERDSFVSQSISQGINAREAQDAFDSQFSSMLSPEGAKYLQPKGGVKYTPSVADAGKSYEQVGLLANTSYDPTDPIDQLAKNYMDRYLKNAKMPTSYELGLGRGGANSASQNKFSKAQTRANDLYFEATGSSLPSIEDLKGTWKVINNNKGIANKLAIASDTVEKNFDLAIEGEIKKNVNKNATIINKILNPIYLALGDPAVNQAMVSNGTISQEFANLISVRNSQGTLAADKIMAEELIKFGTSVEAQKAVVERLKQEAINIKGAVTTQQEELWKQVDPLQQNPNNPNRKNGLETSNEMVGTTPSGINYQITITP